MAGHMLPEDAAIPAGPASVAAIAWRFRGELRVTVIAKASFAFAHEASMPRVDAQPIVRDEVHHGNNAGRTVRLTTDLYPYLARAEILFTGHAHTPAGATLETLPVRLGIFDGARAVVDKTVIVRQKGGFQTVPLVYERAYGGIGWQDNPYGVGVKKGSGEPSLFDAFDASRVACFAPMSRSWPARKKRLGAMSLKAFREPIIEIPGDFDWEYFQAAPSDQRLDALRGDEWIVMDGLNPDRPRVRTCLPGARGLARIFGLSPSGIGEGQPLLLHADVLRIDGDEQRCTLTFRGAFSVPAETALPSLRVLAGVETAGAPIAWTEAARAPAASAAATPSIHATITLDESDLLPIDAVDARDGGGGTLMLDDSPGRVIPLLEGTIAFDGEGSPAPSKSALPFQAPPAGAPSSAASAAPPRTPRAPAAFTGTVEQTPAEQARASRSAALPFGEKARPAEPPSPEVEPPGPPPAPPARAAGDPGAEAPKTKKAESKRASPWGPAPPAPPKAPKPPPPNVDAQAASPELKQGLYGKFGGKR